MRVWDIQNQKCALTFSDLKQTAYDLSWSHNGSLIGTLTKDKYLSFFDPRKDTTAQRVITHEGARPQKFVWLGDSQNLLTCGFSKLNNREYAVWDTRNFAAPVVKRQLDDLSGTPFTYFDEEHKIVYVAGKGESAVCFFQYNPSNPALLENLGFYRGAAPQKGLSFLPKRVVDQSSNEISRAVRLTATTVEYVSFKVKRRTAEFQADLYPPIASTEPAMKFEEYISGVDKEALRFELRPETAGAGVGTAKTATFAAKETVVQTVIVTSDKRRQEDEEIIKGLERKIAELEEELRQSRQEAQALREEVEGLTQSNENNVSEKQRLEVALGEAQSQIASLQASQAVSSHADYSGYGGEASGAYTASEPVADGGNYSTGYYGGAGEDHSASYGHTHAEGEAHHAEHHGGEHHYE